MRTGSLEPKIDGEPAHVDGEGMLRTKLLNSRLMVLDLAWSFEVFQRDARGSRVIEQSSLWAGSSCRRKRASKRC